MYAKDVYLEVKGSVPQWMKEKFKKALYESAGGEYGNVQSYQMKTLVQKLSNIQGVNWAQAEQLARLVQAKI